MTKKEMKALRRMEKFEREKRSGSSSMAKWIILAVGAVLFIAAFGFIVFSIKQQKNKPVEISSSGWVRGNPEAKTVLVEYGDFQCPACRAYESIVESAMKDFNGKIKLVFKEFPLLSVHPNGMLGARAAEAAGAQGKFWEMHDWLYQNQDSWSLLSGNDARTKIIEGAKGLKLNTDQLQKDMDKKETTDKIMAQENEGIALGVNATPTFFLNNKKIDNNPQNYGDFKKLIQSSLK